MVDNSTSPPVKLQSGVGEGSVVGPFCYHPASCATSPWFLSGIDVLIHLIVYADNISAENVADTEAELQLAVNALMDEFST